MIELYEIINGKMIFITKYEITSAKVQEMRALKLPWKSNKDVLVLYMREDKVCFSFLTISTLYRL